MQIEVGLHDTARTIFFEKLTSSFPVGIQQNLTLKY